MTPSGCMACENSARIDALPPRECVVVTDHWRVAHAFNSALPGWMVMLPRRHVTALHDLDDDEIAPLGPLLRELSAALARVTGCLKAYVMFFAEGEGFAHLHLHVVPRMPDFPPEVRGPSVFAFLRQSPDEWLSDPELDEISLLVRAELDA
jgi:diadenosine tetraphosphate (Ap4A) HIT family hydrolase